MYRLKKKEKKREKTKKEKERNKKDQDKNVDKNIIGSHNWYLTPVLLDSLWIQDLSMIS